MLLITLMLAEIVQKAKEEILKNIKDIRHVDFHLELEDEDVQRVEKHQ